MKKILFLLGILMLINTSFAFDLERFTPDNSFFSFFINKKFFKQSYDFSKKQINSFTQEVFVEIFKDLSDKEIDNVDEINLMIYPYSTKENKVLSAASVIMKFKDVDLAIKGFKKRKLGFKKSKNGDFEMTAESNKKYKFYGFSSGKYIFITVNSKEALDKYKIFFKSKKRVSINQNKLFMEAKSQSGNSLDFGFINAKHFLKEKIKNAPIRYVSFSTKYTKDVFAANFFVSLDTKEASFKNSYSKILTSLETKKSKKYHKQSISSEALAFLSLTIPFEKLPWSDAVKASLETNASIILEKDIFPVFDDKLSLVIYPPDSKKFPDFLIMADLKDEDAYNKLMQKLELSLVRYGIILNEQNINNRKVNVLNIPFAPDFQASFIVNKKRLYICTNPLISLSAINNNTNSILDDNLYKSLNIKDNPLEFMLYIVNLNKAAKIFQKSNGQKEMMQQLNKKDMARLIDLTITPSKDKNSLYGEIKIVLPKDLTIDKAKKKLKDKK